ncbi:unnamed protein product, partial [marine sediment metagenome]
MKYQFKLYLLVIVAVTLGACGIHFKVHNPKKPGKIPNFSEEIVLLGGLTKLRTCFDVNYYDLSINIDPNSKTLDGSVEIHAIALNDFDSLQIDLHPNFKISNLIDDKTSNQLNYRRKERAVVIHFPQKNQNRFVIKVEYNGKPIVAKKPPWKGGFIWLKDELRNPWIGVACESEGASIWWPLKDSPTDEPDSIRMHYTVPKDLTAVANGQFEGVDKNEETSTYNWFVSYPINTYNVNV